MLLIGKDLTDEELQLLAGVADARGGLREGSRDIQGGMGGAGVSGDHLHDSEGLPWVYFALYEAYHHRSLYADAWRALEEANGLMYASLQNHHHGEASEQQFQQIKEFFTESVLESTRAFCPGYSPSKRPIFVVGMPRSGSTLMERLLAAHSQVRGAGEDTHMAPLVGKFIEAGSTLEGGRTCAKLGKQYFTRMQQLVGASKDSPVHTVDKMLRNVMNIGFIYLMVPNACVLHMVRDPMDVGFSNFRQPFEGRGTPWAWNLTDIAREYSLLQQVADHWRTVLPDGFVNDVHYEALVATPETELRRVLEICGVPWEDGLLDFHKQEAVVHTSSAASVRSPVTTDRIGGWRAYAQHLTPLAEALGMDIS